VTDKERNKKIVTPQIQGPFKHWERIEEFRGDNKRIHISHIVEYVLPAIGKIASMRTGGHAAHKIKQVLHRVTLQTRGLISNGNLFEI
jgi:ligand-binding SRPBCC domain-containing protein